MYMQPNIESGFSHVRMVRSKNAESWLSTKYGKPVHPWVCDVALKQGMGDSEGQYLQGGNVTFDYSYVKRGHGQFNQ